MMFMNTEHMPYANDAFSLSVSHVFKQLRKLWLGMWFMLAAKQVCSPPGMHAMTK
jgi:hypothetical protein